jgi:DNA topoisomerase-6 subunit B
MESQLTLDGKPKAEQTKAHELAKKQREIGIGEFFSRNRHLLGFDNKRKALLTTVKEAVDNALDACEEANILPEISIELIEMGNEKYRVIIEDNGPGIIKKQVGNIFAKLLYGSKFHRLKQSRGQQGIGISAAVMYGQLTTGKHARIVTRISPNKPAQFFELSIDTKKNQPKIIENKEVEWDKEHGTRIEIDLEGSYVGGRQSVDEYLKETAITNPHATIIYTNPKAEQFIFPRVTDQLPFQPKEIKPHPYGIELGYLIDMLKSSSHKTLQSFLVNEFSRVSNNTAKEICENASLLPSSKPQHLSREAVEKLMEGIKKTKIASPPKDCLSPIGSDNLERGIKKEINAEFYAAATRPPSVYRGNPFVIEVGLAYGGAQPADSAIRLMRFANRVPLLYQQSACAITNAIANINWRSYGLNQSKKNLPVGPLSVVVHIASVWVPFTSESKEAVAHYPEIIKEVKLAIQEVGRKLAMYVNKKKRVLSESKKRSYIEKYIPAVGESIKEILGLDNNDKAYLEENLKEILEYTRGKLEDLKFDPSKNKEFDEEFAKIGAMEEPEDEQ